MILFCTLCLYFILALHIFNTSHFLSGSTTTKIAHLGKLPIRVMTSAPGHTPLIHGLPDEIALICLARVPRRFHNVLRRVSKRWRELVSSEEWHTCRRRSNLDESWIYVLCRETGTKCYVLAPDSSNRSLRFMHIIEPPCSGRQGVTIEALDKRLFFLGGCSWLNDATDEVYCYDASSNRWSAAAPMPTPRYLMLIGISCFALISIHT